MPDKEGRPIVYRERLLTHAELTRKNGKHHPKAKKKSAGKKISGVRKKKK